MRRSQVRILSAPPSRIAWGSSFFLPLQFNLKDRLRHSPPGAVGSNPIEKSRRGLKNSGAMTESRTGRKGEGYYRSAVEKLSGEVRRLRALRELHSLRVANRSLQQDIDQVRARIEESQDEVIK